MGFNHRMSNVLAGKPCAWPWKAKKFRYHRPDISLSLKETNND